MKTTSGRVTVRRVEPRALPEAGVRRLPKGGKGYNLAVNEAFTIGPDIVIARIANTYDGKIRLVVQAPLTVVLGNPHAISLTE